jgi:hypothetical protein
MRLILCPGKIYARTLPNVRYMPVHCHPIKSSTINAYNALNIRLVKSNDVRWDTKPYSRGETTNAHKSERET